MRGALVVQALRDFEAVYRVHPVKVLGDEFGFVALDGANAVPHQWVVTALQCGNFVDTFLDVVFAKVTLPTGRHLAHIVGTESFRHGEQLHAAWVSCARVASRCHASLYGVEVVA